MTRKGFKTWTMVVEVSVADCWVADGFDMGNDIERERQAVQDMMETRLGYARSDEIEVTVKQIVGPPAEAIRKLQGYAERPLFHTVYTPADAKGNK